MRHVRVSCLLAAATLWCGCAQGSADWSITDGDSNADTEELTPEVVSRDGGALRDAGRADAGQSTTQVPPEKATVSGPTEPKDAGVNPAPPRPPPAEPPVADDAGIAPVPVPDAGLVDPPLTNTLTPCVAGLYVGTFVGELRALNGIVRIDVVGVVRFELPAAEGDSLTLRAGTIVGKDADGHPMQATVSGVLSCTTGELENGRITSGTYTRPDPVFRTRTTTSHFAGVIAAKFTAGERPSGEGTWDVDSARSTRNGDGTFEVELAR